MASGSVSVLASRCSTVERRTRRAIRLNGPELDGNGVARLARVLERVAVAASAAKLLAAAAERAADEAQPEVGREAAALDGARSEACT